MCEATLRQGSPFKKLIDCIKPLVVEANLTLTEAGISLTCMDPHQVAIVDMHLKRNAFEAIRLANRSDMEKSGEKLAISLDSLQKLLKCSDDHDWITLLTLAGSGTLELAFHKPGSTCKRNFSLPLLSLEKDELGKPPRTHPYQVQMRARYFERIIHDLSVVGEVVVIRGDNNALTFRVHGEIANGNIVCTPLDPQEQSSLEDHISIAIDNPTTFQPFETSYSLKYLSMFSKASSVATSMVLYFPTNATNDVLIVEHPLPNEEGILCWCLAARTTPR